MSRRRQRVAQRADGVKRPNIVENHQQADGTVRVPEALRPFIGGRETMLQPKMMIVAQPTWGVDVGAAQLIRQALIDLRDQGVAILVISEELDDLLSYAHRIAVIHDGAIMGIVARENADRQTLGRWMAGHIIDAA